MTRLTKPVTRVIELPSHGPMNVTLTADGIAFRPYRARTTLLIPYGTALVKAAMMKADADRDEKRKRRRGARRSSL